MVVRSVSSTTESSRTLIPSEESGSRSGIRMGTEALPPNSASHRAFTDRPRGGADRGTATAYYRCRRGAKSQSSAHLSTMPETKSKPKNESTSNTPETRGAATMNVKPLADRILVRRLEEPEVKRGGIIIPDTAKEKPQQAEVVATGPGRLTDDGN